MLLSAHIESVSVSRMRDLYGDMASYFVYSTQKMQLTMTYGVCISNSGEVIKGRVCKYHGYPA